MSRGYHIQRGCDPGREQRRGRSGALARENSSQPDNREERSFRIHSGVAGEITVPPCGTHRTTERWEAAFGVGAVLVALPLITLLRSLQTHRCLWIPQRATAFALA